MNIHKNLLIPSMNLSSSNGIGIVIIFFTGKIKIGNSTTAINLPIIGIIALLE
ncbi:MAG: hypothetical protein IKJ75_00675 [Clostridia bacterium]|nr:hypothetical protein [Clostridia bacterium]